MGKWLRWEETRWKIEDTLKAFDLARVVCRKAAAEIVDPKLAKLASSVASAKTRAAVVSLASADRAHASTVDQWDIDQLAINTPGGTIDTAGSLQPHRRGDYITKITAVAPGGDCPLWMEFLDKVTDKDKALQCYLRRVAGYALTGSTKEHVLFFCLRNGRKRQGRLHQYPDGDLWRLRHDRTDGNVHRD